jgi:hypothetical protein
MTMNAQVAGTDKGAMFGMPDESLFLAKARHATWNSDTGSYLLFKDLK